MALFCSNTTAIESDGLSLKLDAPTTIEVADQQVTAQITLSSTKPKQITMVSLEVSQFTHDVNAIVSSSEDVLARVDQPQDFILQPGASQTVTVSLPLPTDPAKQSSFFYKLINLIFAFQRLNGMTAKPSKFYIVAQAKAADHLVTASDRVEIKYFKASKESINF